jgi:beta propeller repeat protein
MRGSFAFAFLVPVVTISVSVRAQAAVTGSVQRLSTGSLTDQQTSPAVSGTNVVWTDANSASGGPANYDIFMLNLLTGGLVNLTNTPTEQEVLEDIDGGSVVWTHSGAGHPGDIVLYDIASNSQTTVAFSTSTTSFQQPTVKGRYVAFVRVTADQLDIDVWDNLLGLPIAVTDDAWAQARPRLKTDLVVFEDYAAGNANILGYNLATRGPSFPIATGANPEIMPDVDGNIVVWIEQGAAGDQLFTYNLITGALQQITTVASAKNQPRISGEWIVWTDGRGGDFDLYAYNLSTGVESPLVTGPGDQALSDIDGNRVVYTDNSAGFEQVYMFTIGATPPPPPPPPPDLPFGCDPAHTDLVSGPVTLTRTTRRPVFGEGSFETVSGRDYYVCVENGLPDKSQRTSQFLFSVDGAVALSPAEFKPNDNPPHFVAAKLFADNGHHSKRDGIPHDWNASLYGAQIPTTVSITVRASK